MKPGRVSAAVAADMLGVSGPTFAKLIAVGAFPRSAPKVGYNLREVTRGTVAYYQRQASGRSDNPDENRVLSSARARAANAQAAERELRFGILRGDYVSARAVVHVVGGYVMQVRERLLSLPGKWAANLVGRELEEISDVLVDEVHEALDDLAAARISADIADYDREGGRHHARTNGGDDVDGVGLDA
jgi:hypothetical protein